MARRTPSPLPRRTSILTETRFDRPTFVRIDDLGEVLRLGPGLAGALLDRPSDYYLQRRVFSDPCREVAAKKDRQPAWTALPPPRA